MRKLILTVVLLVSCDSDVPTQNDLLDLSLPKTLMDLKSMKRTFRYPATLQKDTAHIDFKWDHGDYVVTVNARDTTIGSANNHSIHRLNLETRYPVDFSIYDHIELDMEYSVTNTNPDYDVLLDIGYMFVYYSFPDEELQYAIAIDSLKNLRMIDVPINIRIELLLTSGIISPTWGEPNFATYRFKRLKLLGRFPTEN